MNFKKFYNVIYDDKGRRHWKPTSEATETQAKPEENKKIVNLDYSKPLEARNEEIVSRPLGITDLGKDVKEPDKLIGYHCKLCNFTSKDNHSWLDHLNSLAHNRHLGNHMKVEKVTVDVVSSHLSNLKHKKAKKPAPKLEDILKRLEGQPTKKQKIEENIWLNH